MLVSACFTMFCGTATWLSFETELTNAPESSSTLDEATNDPQKTR